MSDIRDVAKAAGVSASTVSRVLTGRHADLVAPDTRRRVIEAAQRLDYRASAAATALVGGRTSTVALHASQLRYNTGYSMRFVDITQRIADEHGFHLLVVPGKPEFNPADLLRERRVDVLVWTHFPVERADEMAAQTVAQHQAVVGCGAVDQHPPAVAHCGHWDDRAGFATAVDHLADLGHQSLAFLGGAQIGTLAWPNLVAGYLEGVARRGLTGHVVTLADEIHNLQAGADMAREAMRLRPRPTALVARNDDFALGAIHALTEDGIAVPGDVSVVGYNDTPMAAFCAPALTSIRVPISESLHELLPAVLAQVSGAESPRRMTCAHPIRLFARRSTGPAP